MITKLISMIRDNDINQIKLSDIVISEGNFVDICQSLLSNKSVWLINLTRVEVPCTQNTCDAFLNLIEVNDRLIFSSCDVKFYGQNGLSPQISKMGCKIALLLEKEIESKLSSPLLFERARSINALPMVQDLLREIENDPRRDDYDEDCHVSEYSLIMHKSLEPPLFSSDLYRNIGKFYDLQKSSPSSVTLSELPKKIKRIIEGKIPDSVVKIVEEFLFPITYQADNFLKEGDEWHYLCLGESKGKDLPSVDGF